MSARMQLVRKKYVKRGWENIKSNLKLLNEYYSFETVKLILEKDNYFETLFGRAKNRTLMKDDPKLYNSIYKYTSDLETAFKSQKSYKGHYNFKYRIKYIVDHNCNLKTLRCKCGKKYTWNVYCRHCPDYHYTWSGKTHTDITKFIRIKI